MRKHKPYGININDIYVKIIESLSIWTGNNKDAWLDSKRLNRHRKLLKCERHGYYNENHPDIFYEIGCDVARYSANTAITVIKVLPNSSGTFQKNVIYVEVINGANYITEQAPRLKKLIQLYNPREIVIDGNGRSNTWPTWKVISSIKSS